MHPYATDSPERRNVVFGLSLLSVFLAWSLNRVLQWLGITIPWWLDAPSVVGIFGSLYAIFDKWLWRWEFWRGIGLIRVPKLDRNWQGEGESSYGKQQYTVRAKIRQNWTSMSISLESEESVSHSLSASFLLNQPDGIVLSYEYRNDPKPKAKDTMHSHRGTAVLRLTSSSTLEGEYYTGRDRQNYGSLCLGRVEEALHVS